MTFIVKAIPISNENNIHLFRMFFVNYVLHGQNICNFEEVRNCRFPPDSLKKVNIESMEISSLLSSGESYHCVNGKFINSLQGRKLPLGQ